MENITLTINGKNISCTSGTSILEAAKQMGLRSLRSVIILILNPLEPVASVWLRMKRPDVSWPHVSRQLPPIWQFGPIPQPLRGTVRILSAL